MPIRRCRSCRDYRRNRVVTPAVQTLLMEGTARNTRNRRLVPTRSMAEIQLYAVGTEEHGNVSVTSMYHSILSVNCVLRKESLCLPKRFITSCHCQKVEHMRGLTSLLYVSHVMQGVTLKVYRDNKFPSSIVVSYSAVAKDGIVFEENDTLNQKVQKTSQKEAKRMTAAVYELADFIPCTPKDDSVTGIYGALRQAGSSDDEPYYNIYKIQEVFPEIWLASMQDENGNYFWSDNFTINTNAQKIKAYTTSVTSYSLMMLNKKTSSGTVSDYVAYFDYDQQKNEEVCSIYKIRKKDNKNYAIPVEGEQNQPMSILDKYEIVPTGRMFYNYNFSGDILYSGSDQNTKPNIDTNGNRRLVSSIRLSGISKKIAAGKKLTLKATVLPNNASNKKLIWKSSNPKVATVTQNGIVTLKKKTGGKKVTITATAKDGSKKYAFWKITSMKGIVKKVKITGNKPVKTGKKLKLKAKITATKKANTKLLWTSGNTKYATVNAKGIVTTKKSAKGKTVKITAMATDGSGKKHTVKIKIK